jgi:hypothetical protein
MLNISLLLNISIFCFSAHTSKRIAKVIIVLIWFCALSLAAPMAMSWEIIMEDEQDSGKLNYFIFIISVPFLGLRGWFSNIFVPL